MTKATPSVMVVIPARYGSSRFRGKPLVMLGRKPLIQHVYEQAAACRAVTEVLVATDGSAAGVVPHQWNWCA